MSINIDEIDETVMVIIAIYSTFNFIWWQRICDDWPVMLAIMRYNPQRKGIIHVDNSIENGK